MGKRIFLTEEQFIEFIRYAIINENVYVNDVNNKKKTAKLTYNNFTRNVGSKNSLDYLKTDKMDTQNADTYEVTLKGGVICYNITSIKGSDVMHYFKNKWGNNKKTTIKVKNDETNQIEDYDLTMMSDEEKAFFDKFMSKVGFVVKYCMNKFRQQNNEIELNALSIYPVPSSSGFNLKMANLLSKSGLYGVPVQVIDSNILQKNLDNVERDEEFIERNKEIYNSPYYAVKNVDDATIDTHLTNSLNRMRGISNAQKGIIEINELVKKLLSQLNNYHSALKNGDSRDMRRMLQSICDNYRNYYDAVSNITNLSKYNNVLKNTESTVNFEQIAKMLKYSKGPSIENRSNELWGIVKNYLRGVKSNVTGKPYTKIDLAYYDPTKFEIKNFTNSERMGIKNIYTPNDKNPELVKRELERIKGTVFLIFDDNISGGATLSDICYQCKNMGIENIIPITFGEMNEKWTLGILPLTSPEMKDGHAQWNF